LSFVEVSTHQIDEPELEANMSFGFSVSDFITATEKAFIVRNNHMKYSGSA